MRSDKILVKLKNDYIYILTNMVVLTIFNNILNINNATKFDKFYSIILIMIISIYGILYKDGNIYILIKKLVIYSVIFSTIVTLQFYIFSKSTQWFLYERESSTWLGIAGLSVTIIYCLIGIIIGVILWVVKNKIFWK